MTALEPTTETATAPAWDATRAMDTVQAVMAAAMPLVDLPLRHTFTPGLYSRTIFMPAGVLVVSKIHKTEHQFAITAGRVNVWSPDLGLQHLAAPHLGVTKPGTRRVLFILEDCLWTTFHATPLTDPEAIEAEIIEPHAVPELVTAEVANLLKGFTP